MRKIIFIVSEFRTLIAQHKLYFLTPLLLILTAITILFFKLGPGIVISFIYAGV